MGDGSPREASCPHPCPALGPTYLVTHVGLLSAVCLHMLCESLLHGVDTATHRAWEGAQLWGLRRNKRGSDGEILLLGPTPQAALQQAPFPGQGPRLTGSGLFFLEKKGTGVRPSLLRAHPIHLDPVSALRVPTTTQPPFF